MDKLNVFFFGMVFFFLKAVPCDAQEGFSVIGTTYVNYATAYSNGYKIVPVSQLSEDTLYAVYSYNEDTCYFAYSYNRGKTWESQPLFATLFGNAHYPSLDVYNSLPYVVSEGDSGGKGEIFLKCPFDYCCPQRISHTPGHSTLPAIIIDDSRNMHIVWQDDTPGNWEIYYCCAYYDTAVSDTINLSNFSNGSDMYPSISIYNGNEVHVIWERYDPTIDCPYSIVHKYLSDGTWSEEEFLAGPTGIPLHYPSLDFSHGEDSLSAAWEDSSSGKSDAYFYKGNEGEGWPTTGDSKHPVVSTVGKTWSYVYWEDNSDGYNDIYGHFYYSMTPEGWCGSRKFRDVFGDEDMHHPSVANCYVVWTQGNSAPYKVMFRNEGYPIGVEERNRKLQNAKLEVYPNPFTQTAVIRVQGLVVSERQKISLQIYDLSGRLVRTFSLTTNHSSLITDLSSGIYFLKVKGYKPVKVVKLR